MALIADYPMQDDAASTTVVASTGSNATLGGGDNTSAKTVTGPGGLFPKALSLNGTDDFIQTPTISFGSRVVCVSCWLNMAWANTKMTFELSASPTGTSIRPIFAAFSSATTNVEATRIRGSSTNSRNYTGSYSAWRHYVYIFDTNQATADGAQVDLYIDGVLQTRVSAPDQGATSTNNFQDDPLYIGSRAGTSLFRDMSIAGFKVYNHRLSQSEIDDLYNEKNAVAAVELNFNGGFVNMSGGFQN